jgi:hypothetical protein
MSWNSYNSHTSHSQSVPTLDLHGYTRDTALRRLTDFLEASRGKVCIVTGSGSHSQHGPILRSAVERLFQKREMEYQRISPGRFIVDAQSGHVLYKKLRDEDTKLIIKEHGNEEGLASLHYILRNNNKAVRPAYSKSNSTVSTASVSESSNVDWNDSPTLQEVARDDSEVVKALEESARLAKLRMKEAEEEKLALQRTIFVSRHDKVVMEEEQQALQHALEFSTRENEFLDARKKDEDDTLLSVIALSIQEVESQLESEKRDVETALALSCEQSHPDDQDDDRILQQVLALSALEF